jgi:DNA-directed RNA polymerase subunit beta'
MAQKNGSGMFTEGRDNTVIRLSLASPDVIRSWSKGEVKKPETINYRTFKPERDGLFCERIFGPVKSWECSCGKYKKLRHKDIICDRCGVEVVDSKVRRDRMGHIELAAPVAHVWFVRSVPSRLAVMLGMSGRELEKVIYYEQFIVIDPGKTGLKRRQLLSEAEVRKIQQEIYGKTLKAKIGAEAVRDLLKEVDQNVLSRLIQIAMVLPLSMDDLELGVANEEAYVVFDPGKTGFRKYECISEKEFKEDQGKPGFKAKTGDEAIKDLWKEAEALSRVKDRKEISSQKMKELQRRLKVVEAFRRSGNRPEWMVLEVLPVQPPDLRPLVPLDGGRFATSDLNDLYRRVINRNNRLKRLIEIKAPEIIIQNEKRMLQESVDALFDNGRGGHLVKGTGNRPLKSLSDMLKGKPGRFRQNLLGKRVDYSGRSVIVVGPNLKLHECGLPKEMALELFKPFIIRKLEERAFVHTIKSAKRMVERSSPEVWDVLEEVIEEHPVMLNRAPTLHRLSIQAFQPILIEGKAIQIHPLVCSAFNADFDGDQMAVHVPLSVEAQLEARLLMLATNNILSPANGHPIVGPGQDMVMGCYYLTAMPLKGWRRIGVMGKEGRIGAATDKDRPRAVVYTPAEVQQLYDHGHAKLHDEVLVKYENEAKAKWTSVGRVLFSMIFPESIRFAIPTFGVSKGTSLTNDVIEMGKPLAGLSKGVLTQPIEYLYEHLGRAATIQFLDDMKKTGFEFATRAGVTVGLEDLPDIDAATIENLRKEFPKEVSLQKVETKSEIISRSRTKATDVHMQFQKNQITERERYKSVVDAWTQATNDVTGALHTIMETSQNGLNPIHMMAISGARGREDQVRQLAGMRGLMARPSQRITGDVGEIIEFPIVSNFKEGLSVFEYFVSTHGARKGLADTALKTADAGYLTRRLVDVCQDVKIIEEDCGTINGVRVKAIKDGAKMIEPLQDRIRGRVAVDSIVDPTTDEVYVRAGRVIRSRTARKIEESGIIESVKVRSVLTCETKGGICAKCYGRDLAVGSVIDVVEVIKLTASAYKAAIAAGVDQASLANDVQARLEAIFADKQGMVFSPEAFAEIHAEVEKELKPGVPVEEVFKRHNVEEIIELKLQVNEGLVQVGEAVGVIAGQSIGEPGTQLTLRTFHVGGTASWIVAEGSRKSKNEGELKYGENLKVLRSARSRKMITLNRGTLRILDAQGYELESHEVPYGSTIVDDGARIKPGMEIAKWNPYTVSIYAEKSGKVAFREIIDGKTMLVEEVQDADPKKKEVRKERRIVEPKDPADRSLHPQVVIEDSEGGQVAAYTVPIGASLIAVEGQDVEVGDEIARLPQEEDHKTGDITGGLPRVAELFDARRPKSCAVISQIEGTVRIAEQVKGARKVAVVPPKGDAQDYLIPMGRHLVVRNGDKVRAGDPLTDGSIDPHDILEAGGREAVQEFLTNKIQEVYRLQGVKVNDKHIEVIIRQMLKKVNIQDPGDTTFLVGQQVDKARFMAENSRIHEKGGRPAKGKDILLGITRAALSTESWISAASFQETTRVLAEAAVNGADDKLAGLKENVIMGHLISAGTGIFDEDDISLDMPEGLDAIPTAASITATVDEAALAFENLQALGNEPASEPAAGDAEQEIV